MSVYAPELCQAHPDAEKLVNHLTSYCDNDLPHFFHVMLAYHFAKMAAMMRVTIKTNKDKIPVNCYAINLAPSGAGKGKSMSFIENHLTNQFNDRFENEVLPLQAETEIAKLAHLRSVRNNTDIDKEMEFVKAEYDATGEWISAFDSATTPAMKQFRHKLLMTKTGSLNFEIDEIGDNLTGEKDALSKFLELYDLGTIKESLVKNTKENKRLSKIKGATPTNVIMFGTASSLLDGSKIEDEFNSMIEKGMGRRCIFGFAKDTVRDYEISAEDIFAQGQSNLSTDFIDKFADHLCTLADPINVGTTLYLEKDEEILWIDYMLYNRKRAREMSEFDTSKRIEMEHRHFKALKLAGAYAFVDSSANITKEHLYNAFYVVEKSGEQFHELLTRDRPYIKIAKYLGDINRPVTQADLVADLPFYKGSQSQRAELLTMATAWGYNNNVVIKKSFENGIEFLSGESLSETSLDELTVAYSTHVAYNYINDSISWDNLQKLTQMQGYHWITHNVVEGHRCEDKTQQGFNLLVLDVDGGTSLETAKLLFKDYKCMFYTTKSHQTAGEDRFRIIFPMRYTLKLDAKDFKEFMQSVFDWLPFEVDDCTGQRARKWECNQGELHLIDGELFDPLAFIPRTSKNEERKAKLVDQQSLSNLERWFINNTGDGNRSNQLIKYALLLVDAGKSFTEVEQGVYDLNSKIADKLPEEEIASTILVSARKAYNKVA